VKNSGWEFNDNLLIGHSSGATTILNLLQADWFPKVKASVLVSTFLNEKLTKDADWVDPGQFDGLFLSQYNPVELTKKCSKFYFVHGSDDPFCDIEDVKLLCQKVNGSLTVIENGHHLGSTWGRKEFPQLLQVIESEI
jgi:predicted alpha/beta hydrolase family esterase